MTVEENVFAQEFQVRKNSFWIGREFRRRTFDAELAKTDPGGVSLRVGRMKRGVIVIVETAYASDVHESEYGAHEV